MLYDDDKDAAEALRACPVAKAERSPSALAKRADRTNCRRRFGAQRPLPQCLFGRYGRDDGVACQEPERTSASISFSNRRRNAPIVS